jgi:O-antigen/teichoic acid export membrane protein
MSVRAEGGGAVNSFEDGKTAASRIFGRNLLALVASQFVTTPVSLVVNAMLARSLGADSFGAIYFAGTVLTLAFLLVDWGGQAQIAAEVARDPASAPRIFGTGLVFRLILSLGMLAGLRLFAAVMGSSAAVHTAIVLGSIRFAITTIGSLCNAVLRGFEKVHWHAAATVAGTLLDAILVIGTLLSGGGLRQALLAQIAAAALTLLLQFALVLRLGLGRPQISRVALHALVGGGFGFFVLKAVLSAQPYLDASFLSALAPAAALGWYSAAARVSGVLVFPALTMHLALYPTLARLWKDDRATFEAMVRLALRAVTIFGLLAATATVAFADTVVQTVYGKNFAPAATDLALLSGYILFVYTNILIGTAVMAAGRQLRWAAVQTICLAASAGLNPFLIPWTQHAYGNGGIGVCIYIGLAEIVMTILGLRLLPGAVRHGAMPRTARRSAVAAVCMGLVAWLFRRAPWLAAPLSTAVYLGLIWIQREVDADLLMLVRDVVFRRATPDARTVTPG